ncbi:response regulator [Roseomonas populi]|uniref:Response regulator n=1 Tax=Roseomonas populi TaxID=3121582 RepID=A0ABT1X3Z4_9PROT|nr:response regulator [Roseomonas pecuniae]MCR0982797.1 response regulator [Roseomonas pecuniae]
MPSEALVATDEKSVLIAEDDRFDQLIIKRAFKAAQLSVSVRFVEHGEELLAYLRSGARPSETGALTLPAVIFLDLNMPVVDGWAALRELRSEPRWANIPVIVMSTLTHEDDIARVYASGASAYFTKPTSFDDMVQAIRASASPWLKPPGSDPARHIH